MVSSISVHVVLKDLIRPNVYQSQPALDVISCVQQHMTICSCQGRQRQHTDLAVSPSPDLMSGISYLRLCVYHRHLDSFKASWRQYFFARPTRHDSARSWLLRLLELRLTNFPTYLLNHPKISASNHDQTTSSQFITNCICHDGNAINLQPEWFLMITTQLPHYSYERIFGHKGNLNS